MLTQLQSLVMTHGRCYESNSRGILGLEYLRDNKLSS